MSTEQINIDAQFERIAAQADQLDPVVYEAMKDPALNVFLTERLGVVAVQVVHESMGKDELTDDQKQHDTAYEKMFSHIKEKYNLTEEEALAVFDGAYARLQDTAK